MVTLETSPAAKAAPSAKAQETIMDIKTATEILKETIPLVPGTQRRIGPWKLQNGAEPPAVGTVIKTKSGASHSTVDSVTDFHGFALVVVRMSGVS
jgi:hypothetical protein